MPVGHLHGRQAVTWVQGEPPFSPGPRTLSLPQQVSSLNSTVFEILGRCACQVQLAPEAHLFVLEAWFSKVLHKNQVYIRKIMKKDRFLRFLHLAFLPPPSLQPSMAPSSFRCLVPSVPQPCQAAVRPHLASEAGGDIQAHPFRGQEDLRGDCGWLGESQSLGRRSGEERKRGAVAQFSLL